jgi:hypothetical protein
MSIITSLGLGFHRPPVRHDTQGGREARAVMTDESSLLQAASGLPFSVSHVVLVDADNSANLFPSPLDIDVQSLHLALVGSLQGPGTTRASRVARAPPSW